MWATPPDGEVRQVPGCDSIKRPQLAQPGLHCRSTVELGSSPHSSQPPQLPKSDQGPRIHDSGTPQNGVLRSGMGPPPQGGRGRTGTCEPQGCTYGPQPGVVRAGCQPYRPTQRLRMADPGDTAQASATASDVQHLTWPSCSPPPPVSSNTKDIPEVTVGNTKYYPPRTTKSKTLFITGLSPRGIHSQRMQSVQTL